VPAECGVPPAGFEPALPE